MQRMRLTIRHNHEDPTDDLRVAARIRRDLWAHSSVEVDPASPVHGTHRDKESNAYFEFSTNYVEEVKRIIQEYRYDDRVILDLGGEVGPPCENCGNISGLILPTICPICSFRNISPCASCRNEIPRQSYLLISGDAFQGPTCASRVQLRFHDPMYNAAGYYHQPHIIVQIDTENDQ